MLYKNLQFLQPFLFTGGRKLSILCHLSQFGVGKQGERVDRNKVGIELTEQAGAIDGIAVAVAFSCQSCHVNQIIFNAGLVQFAALGKNILGGVAFVC